MPKFSTAEEVLETLHNTYVQYLAIKDASSKFKDVRVYMNDDGQGAYCICTKDLAGLINHMTYTKSDGGATYVWLYYKNGNERIYYDPPFVHIASVNDKGFGFKPAEGLEKIYEDTNIPKKFTDDIKSYLASLPPIDYL